MVPHYAKKTYSPDFFPAYPLALTHFLFDIYAGTHIHPLRQKRFFLSLPKPLTHSLFPYIANHADLKKGVFGTLRHSKFLKPLT